MNILNRILIKFANGDIIKRKRNKRQSAKLRNDTRFAEMGLDDGVLHVNDLEVSRELHENKMEFSLLG